MSHASIASTNPSPEANVSNPDYVVEVDSLSVEFATSHGWQRVVKDVSFKLPRGRVMGLVGESGSGKSVTSLALMGLLPAGSARVAGGHMWFQGQDLAKLRPRSRAALRGSRMAMIFQEPMTSLNPAFSVGAQIAEAVRRHEGVSRKVAWSRAVQALDDVGIAGAATRARRYPHEFSGGMRQRAMIAMAISCGPELLIADEPTTALDVTVQAQILNLLTSMCESHGLSLLLITHNMGVVADVCDDVSVMYAGEVVERNEVVDLFDRPRHPYTEGLLRSVPHPDGVTPLVSIPGSTPSPWQMPTGCRFHPRCPYSTEACTTGEPDLAPAGLAASRCVRIADLDLRGVHV